MQGDYQVAMLNRVKHLVAGGTTVVALRSDASSADSEWRILSAFFHTSDDLLAVNL